MVRCGGVRSRVAAATQHSTAKLSKAPASLLAQSLRLARSMHLTTPCTAVGVGRSREG